MNINQLEAFRILSLAGLLPKERFIAYIDKAIAEEADVAYELIEASLAASGSIDAICLPIKEYVDGQPCDIAAIKQMIMHFVAGLPLESSCQALYTLAVTCPFLAVDETAEMHGIADSMDLFKAGIYGNEQEIRQRLKSFIEAIAK